LVNPHKPDATPSQSKPFGQPKIGVHFPFLRGGVSMSWLCREIRFFAPIFGWPKGLLWDGVASGL
ncbi:MAG: hypothetical protein AAFV62_08775, partial [Pseudomonadota bacterium]